MRNLGWRHRQFYQPSTPVALVGLIVALVSLGWGLQHHPRITSSIFFSFYLGLFCFSAPHLRTFRLLAVTAIGIPFVIWLSVGGKALALTGVFYLWPLLIIAVKDMPKCLVRWATGTLDEQ